MQVFLKKVKKMVEEKSIVDLFDCLLKDKTEKKIIKLIIDNKETEEILDQLIKKGGKK